MRRPILGAALVVALASAATAQQHPRVPAAEAIRMLVTTTVIALNQANLTGNYTVLRDLGAPAFQQANTAAKLSLIFQKLREQNLDLNPVILLEPRFARAPAVDQQGFLKLAGNYPTRPLQVNFDLAFQPVEGHWRLFAISLGTTPASGGASPAPPPPRPPVKPQAPPKTQ